MDIDFYFALLRAHRHTLNRTLIGAKIDGEKTTQIEENSRNLDLLKTATTTTSSLRTHTPTDPNRTKEKKKTRKTSDKQTSSEKTTHSIIEISSGAKQLRNVCSRSCFQRTHTQHNTRTHQQHRSASSAKRRNRRETKRVNDNICAAHSFASMHVCHRRLVLTHRSEHAQTNDDFCVYVQTRYFHFSYVIFRPKNNNKKNCDFRASAHIVCSATFVTR